MAFDQLKMPNKMNAFSNRLDSDLLESINTNEYAIHINPIKKGCKIWNNKMI